MHTRWRNYSFYCKKGLETMNEERKRWNAVMEQMRTDNITLSPKISATVRISMTGLLHILARYKFAMRMMANRKNLRIIDFGCNDGLGDLMFRQSLDAESITGIDFDEEAIKWAKENLEDDVLRFVESDFFEIGEYKADCAVSLDVIEHIPKEKETKYRDIIYDSLTDDGFAIIGTPNVTLYPYANPINKGAHINNFSQERLYELFSEKFRNVFIFGMNDESVNTGFYPFSCYIMALCCK